MLEEDPGAVVLRARAGHTLVVTINRPESRNAINTAVALGIGEALEVAEHDPDVWAVVVTGAGNKAFSAGADLKAARGPSQLAVDERLAAWGFAGFVRHHISKPVIAAVNGFALGGGTEISLACDLVVAGENASFGLPEVTRGIVAAAGGAFRLPEQIPRKVAMEMMLTGEPITARRALELGLVNRVVPTEKVVEEAVALAERICSNAPLAVQAAKRIALGMLDGQIPGEQQRWAISRAEIVELAKSCDAKEGRLAFVEKRPAVWTGR